MLKLYSSNSIGVKPLDENYAPSFRFMSIRCGRQMVFSPWLLAVSTGKHVSTRCGVSTLVFQSSILCRKKEEREKKKKTGRETHRQTCCRGTVEFCFLESSHQLHRSKESVETASWSLNYIYGSIFITQQTYPSTVIKGVTSYFGQLLCCSSCQGWRLSLKPALPAFPTIV